MALYSFMLESVIALFGFLVKCFTGALFSHSGSWCCFWTVFIEVEQNCVFWPP